MIFLLSVWRNAEDYIDRYAAQTEALRPLLHEPLHVIAVEGDSEDRTWGRLNACSTFDTVLKCEHGGPKFDSIDHALRWRQISTASNVALCAANRLAREGDQAIYVESDLMWHPKMMVSLLEDLDDVDVVAPMSMMGDRFYDVYGHRKDGQQFSAWPPHYEGWAADGELTEIDSSGSCFAMNYEPLRVAEFSAISCILGVGESVRKAGYSYWIDPRLKVEHP